MRHTRTFGRFTTSIAIASLDESSAAVLRAEQYEDAFALGANTPLRLDDPELMWIVVSGEVDLFHVRSSSDEFLASRRYVGTLSAGEVIAGAKPAADTGDGVLIAVGFGGASLQTVIRRAIDEQEDEGARIVRAIAIGLAETIGRAMHRESRATARPLGLEESKVTLGANVSVTA